MMTWHECEELIYQDLRRNSCNTSKLTLLRYMITNSSFKMCLWFRLGTYLQHKNVKFLYNIVYWHYKNLMYLTGIQLPLGTTVGGGLQFKHFNGIVINDSAIIGDNVTIFNDVTIGINLQPDGSSKCPVIGDNVVICTGAKIIGGVTVGRNCIIGANAVVTKDIPENSVVAGIPAKILSSGGKEYVEAYIRHK